MHLTYIDESGDESFVIFSALTIPAAQWRRAFKMIREFRRDLRKSDGIYVHAELHAWKFVSGRGQIADRIVPKGRRCQIFKEALQLVTQLPGARLFNAVFPAGQTERAFERLLNRLNRALVDWDSHSVLICDTGKEISFTRIARRLHIYNPISSRYGIWEDTGQPYKNIPIDRIVEDPLFKDSAQSYFLQLVDFCAYSLLQWERSASGKVIPRVKRYGLDKTFLILKPILVKEANTRDPYGIIRP